MNQSGYYKLGLFVIVGAVLLLMVIVVLGAGRFLKDTYTMETYLNESVNGLEVGSSVKFRGVKVGTVSYIGFVMGRYTSGKDSEFRYVLVECELDPEKFFNRRHAELKQELDRDIVRGLRIRPISQGLTGQLFLGIDYLPPASNPPLKITWEPRNLYIPSAPSTLSRIEKAVTEVSETISSVSKEDVEGLMGSFNDLADALGEFLRQADAKTLGQNLSGNLVQTEQIFAQLNQLLRDKETEQLLPNASRMFRAMGDVLDRSGDDIVSTAAHMRITFESLEVAAKELQRALEDPDVDLAQITADMGNASNQVRAASEKFHTVMNRVNELVAHQQVNFEEIMNGIRLLVEDMREITAEAKRYPAGMLFGEPPAQTDPASQP